MIEVSISTIGVFETTPRSWTESLDGDTTFEELVQTISTTYPEVKKILLSDAIEGVIILLNGKSLFLQQGMKTVIRDGDDIFIAPMTHGG